MKHATQMITDTQLRQFSPLGRLSVEDAHELLRTSITVHLSAGTPVFSSKDSGKQLFYLLNGKIELRKAGKKQIIAAGTKEACQPIGRHLPHQEAAIALDDSTLVSFDADMLDLFLNWTNPNAYVVNEMSAAKGHEWLSHLLKSRGLLRLSEQQINILLERMNEVHFNKGEVVVSQDDEDGYFYIIKQGKAVVSRRPMPASKEIKLAELNEGDAFGEEAILTDSPRGATVTMEEPGNLMRLSRQDFSEFLAQPLLETVSWQEAQAMAALGAKFLDIRLEDEYKSLHVPGSINTPLPLLRLKLKQLKQRGKYIVYCDDGSRSAVAAFLLNQNGLDAYILDGGMASALPHLDIEQPEEAESAEENNNARKTGQSAQPQTSEHRSLADYWGATVECVTDEGFSDSDTVNDVEKTRPVASQVQTPAAETAPHIHQPPQQTTLKPHVTPISANINKQYVAPHSNRLAFKAMLASTVVSLAALYGLYAFVSDKPAAEIPQTQVLPATPAPVPAEPNPVPANEQTTPDVSESLSLPPITPFENQPAAEMEDSAPTAPDEIVIIPEAQPTTIEPSETVNSESENITDVTAQPVVPTPAENPQPPLDPATRGFIE